MQKVYEDRPCVSTIKGLQYGGLRSWVVTGLVKAQSACLRDIGVVFAASGAGHDNLLTLLDNCAAQGFH